MLIKEKGQLRLLIRSSRRSINDSGIWQIAMLFFIMKLLLNSKCSRKFFKVVNNLVDTVLFPNSYHKMSSSEQMVDTNF